MTEKKNFENLLISILKPLHQVTLLQLLVATSLASTFLLASSLSLAAALAFVRFRILARGKRLGDPGQLTVAFFHPYCNAGTDFCGYSDTLWNKGKPVNVHN